MSGFMFSVTMYTPLQVFRITGSLWHMHISEWIVKEIFLLDFFFIYIL